MKIETFGSICSGSGIVVDVLVALFEELKNSYIENQSFEVVGNTIAYTLF